MSGKQSTNIRIYLVQFDFKMYACRFEESNTQYTSKWINMIEDTLNRTGLGHIWLLDGSLHNTECIKDRLQLR